MIHCLFEQSGTFKNEFIKLGYSAKDYDIQNEFNETDEVIDLFEQIERAWGGQRSIFDDISSDDMILAFFPCTMFQENNALFFTGKSYQQKGKTDLENLEFVCDRHQELHDMYQRLCKLVIVCLRKGIKLIIENPYTQPHYLTMYWCIEPKLIDKNRRENGDYYKKPTQYWFINCNPQHNFIFEPIEYVEKQVINKLTSKDKTTRRSMIHPQYARRFIKEHLVGII